MIVELTTRITLYTTSDENGVVVRNSRNEFKIMTYEWDVARTEGRKTGETDSLKTVNCPNCGAPVEVNKSAECPFCGTVITAGEHDWVLSGIKGLSQRTYKKSKAD
jgi:hypothetical protein